jgi:hypothetical protein
MQNKGNQVPLTIITGTTAKLLVVNLKTRRGATYLTSPAIAAQHLVAELFVRCGIKLQTGAFWLAAAQEVFSATYCRNTRRSSPKENEKAQC